MSRPSTLKHADKIGRDGQACIDFARLVWTGLSPTMRAWLKRSRNWGGGLKLPITAPRGTQAALRRRGIIEPDPDRWLTELGALVFEAGTVKRVGP